MNRQTCLVPCVMGALLLLTLGANLARAQAGQAATPAQAGPQKPEAATAAEDKDKEEDKSDPFAPEPAPPLPPGMSGSDTNDPRAKLTPGLYDAGEAAMGIKHVLLIKKPDAFQLGTTEAENPKVQKMLGQLGIGNAAKMPKELQLVIAQLAFANSDLAFQGSHLFQGNF